MHNNSLKKINSARLTKNAGRSLAALSGFLTGAASRTTVRSGSVSLGIALIAGMGLLGSEKAIAAHSPTPVSIFLDNHIKSTGTEGPFTATGELNTSGFNTMDVRGTRTGTLHCQTVLTDAQGSITLDLQCQMILTSPTTAGGPGHWAVVNGTGAYANLHGTGSL